MKSPVSYSGTSRFFIAHHPGLAACGLVSTVVFLNGLSITYRHNSLAKIARRNLDA